MIQKINSFTHADPFSFTPMCSWEDHCCCSWHGRRMCYWNRCVQTWWWATWQRLNPRRATSRKKSARWVSIATAKSFLLEMRQVTFDCREDVRERDYVWCIVHRRPLRRRSERPRKARHQRLHGRHCSRARATRRCQGAEEEASSSSHFRRNLIFVHFISHDKNFRCLELVDVRRLKLQQFTQLFTCENDAQQV